MGILARFGEIMESNINAALDKLEDPVKMSDQILRKLMEDLKEVKEETASVMAVESDAERRVQELEEKINDCTESAKGALKAGNEQDARTLLSKKQEYESQLETARGTYQVAKRNADNMRAMYKKLNEDIATLQERRKTVATQQAMTRANNSASKVAERMGKSDALSTFARMEAKAQNALDKSAAMAELNSTGLGTNETDELINKYSAGSDASVDNELEALKKEMGL